MNRIIELLEDAKKKQIWGDHYLGTLPKIGETLWYVATRRQEWVALLSFSASTLKCAARDRWTGWDFRPRYRRLKLVVNIIAFSSCRTSIFSNLVVPRSVPKASGERLGGAHRPRAHCVRS